MTVSLHRILVLLAVATSVLVVSACRDEDDGVAVAHLDFAGNEAFSDGELREVIVTEATGVLPWARTRYFNRPAFDADLERLRRFYADRGYPEATVDAVDVAFNDTRDEVRITIGIDEGPPLTVEAIRFEGLEAVDPELAARARRIPLQVGAPLDRQVLARSAETVVFELRDRGYPEARVTLREAAGASARTSAVTFLIDPGDPAVFGDLEIVGLDRVDASVVRRSMVFRAGDLFRQSQVLESQRELALLGLFDFAHVRPATDGETRPDDQTVAARPPGVYPLPIVATVAEGSPTRLRFGIGYGTEDGPRGSFDWQHANILGGAQRLATEGKYSLRLRDVGIRLTQPFLFGRHVSLQARIGATEVREPDYTSRRLGGQLLAEYRARNSRGLDRWPIERVARVTYTNEALRYRIADDTLDDLSQFEELVALGFDPVTGEGSGRVAALSFDAELSVVDRPLDATNGYRLSVRLEHAASWLGGTYDYDEIGADAEGYVPVGRAVLAGRVRASRIIADDDLDVPFSARYFLGGSSTLRGWGRFQVAPLTPDGLPIGGRALFETSAELRVPLRGAFGAAFFVDAGNVWKDQPDVRLDDLRVAVGPGLRYASPVGILRADLGYQLTRIDGLVIDGQPERRRWRFHLSIGQSF